MDKSQNRKHKFSWGKWKRNQAEDIANTRGADAGASQCENDLNENDNSFDCEDFCGDGCKRVHEEMHEKIHKKMYEHMKTHRGPKCFRYKSEFRNFHRYFKVFRPLTILLTAGILYLLYRGLGAGLATLFVGFVLISKESFQAVIFRRLERRIFKPVEEMTAAVQQIAEGNYSVRIASTVTNEIGMLIGAFNNMASKLEKSEKLKKSYEENRKDLIANISHDLKTPMASIAGYVEVLQSDTEYSVETRERYMKTIYNNTVYMNNLINDLILFSQLDIKQLPFEFLPVSMGDYADGIMEELEIDLEEQGVKLSHVNELSEKVLVKIDAKRITRAIRNIVGNAVKYGGNNLEIQAAVRRKDSFAILSIKDNGLGIPEDMQDKIFERFQRLDQERTKDNKSTGLGLSIAKELVVAHGGRIILESHLGEGSCFSIFLPIYIDEGEVDSGE